MNLTANIEKRMAREYVLPLSELNSNDSYSKGSFISAISVDFRLISYKP